MKNLIMATIATLLLVCPIFAQYTTVTYDVERNWFNEGQPLPAEKAIILKGLTPEGVQLIELNIMSAKKSDLLYQASANTQPNKEFSMPFNFKLRASDKYDFRVDFFRPVAVADRQKVGERLTETLNAYIDVNLSGEKTIKLLKKSKHTIKEMNGLVTDAMASYRIKTPDWKTEFSEIVCLKLEQLEKADLQKGYIKGDTTTTKKAVRNNTRLNLINELKTQIQREVTQMLNREMLVLSDSRMVDNYETETKENGLAVNVGYGGVYLSGKLEDANYGAAPYVGLAFPLGNSVLGSKFLSNSSVTLGFFLDNFEDEKGNEVTGFLVNRPLYVGLDHKLFKFIHLNAGAAFLEGTEINSTNPDVMEDTKVMVRPFVGLSARINLNVGLGK